MTPQEALVRLFTADEASPSWFSEGFLANVPLARVDRILSQVRGAGGRLGAVRPDGAGFLVEMERGAWEAKAALDADGRFTGLLLRPAAVTATVDEAIAAFRALPGEVSVLLTTDGEARGSLEPERALGVGSTFKLAVLAALRAEVEEGRRSWKDIVELAAAHASVPSGFLQTWPDGAPMTLHYLAALMISISDNRATDTLLRLVGREQVEAVAPRNRPFLMTREMEKGGHAHCVSATWNAPHRLDEAAFATAYARAVGALRG